MKRDAERYALERGLYLKLSCLCPTPNTKEGEELLGEKVGAMMRTKEEESRTDEVRQQKWQGKLVEARLAVSVGYNAGKLHLCAQWLEFTNYINSYSPKIYQQYKPKTSNNTDVKCSMCGKDVASISHVLSGYGALAQSKYNKTRHGAALRVLLFELLCDLGLKESAPCWCLPETPKPSTRMIKPVPSGMCQCMQRRQKEEQAGLMQELWISRPRRCNY